MRHGYKKVRLGSDKDHGRSIIKNIAIALIIHEKVKTTETHGKAVLPFVEKLITAAKKSTKSTAIRYLEKNLQHESASKKILETLTEKYKGKNSGYIRRTFLKFRKGDNAHIVLLELV